MDTVLGSGGKGCAYAGGVLVLRKLVRFEERFDARDDERPLDDLSPLSLFSVRFLQRCQLPN